MTDVYRTAKPAYVTPQARSWNPPRLLAEPTAAVITYRQADVLAGICHGRSNAEIAAWFDITVDTVKSHVKALLRSMQARDRAHAAALASSGQLTVFVKAQRRIPVAEVARYARAAEEAGAGERRPES